MLIGSWSAIIFISGLIAERGGKLPTPASSVLGNGIGGWFGGQTFAVPPREPIEERKRRRMEWKGIRGWEAKM